MQLSLGIWSTLQKSQFITLPALSFFIVKIGQPDGKLSNCKLSEIIKDDFQEVTWNGLNCGRKIIE